MASSPSTSEAELATLRERVNQLERLAAIGQLTAGILHEIHNPLNFIINFAHLSGELLGELTDLLGTSTHSDELADVLDLLNGNLTRICENGERAERIIQGMLAQTRGEVPELTPTDLNALLIEFTKLAYQGIRAADSSFNVTLEFRLDANVGLVPLAPGEFSRVILNLILNACYALDERRKLMLTGYRATITVSSHRTADEVQVRIRDNGSGIPEAIKEQLFTPFFTTKPTGEGTGLGLSLSRTIVQDLHRGRLTVESESGVFTEFHICLPLASA
jgi:two-component system NtrC family sensor kinase